MGFHSSTDLSKMPDIDDKAEFVFLFSKWFTSCVSHGRLLIAWMHKFVFVYCWTSNIFFFPNNRTVYTWPTACLPFRNTCGEEHSFICIARHIHLILWHLVNKRKKYRALLLFVSDSVYTCQETCGYFKTQLSWRSIRRLVWADEDVFAPEFEVRSSLFFLYLPKVVQLVHTCIFFFL